MIWQQSAILRTSIVHRLELDNMKRMVVLARALLKKKGVAAILNEQKKPG